LPVVGVGVSWRLFGADVQILLRCCEIAESPAKVILCVELFQFLDRIEQFFSVRNCSSGFAAGPGRALANGLRAASFESLSWRIVAGGVAAV